MTATRAALCASFLFTFIVTTGCTPTPSGKSGGGDETPSPAAHVVRAKELLKDEFALKGLGQYYQTFYNDYNRAPDDIDEFKKHMGGPGVMTYGKDIDEKKIIVRCKIPVQTGTVIAYEAKPDFNGHQAVVVYPDSVSNMKAEELKKLLGTN